MTTETAAIEEKATFENETAMDEAAPEEEAEQAPDTDSFCSGKGVRFGAPGRTAAPDEPSRICLD
jgi:hypothetical protein